jgi:hypothetical protein
MKFILQFLLAITILTVQQVKHLIDNLAALYAWILTHKTTAWADNFVIPNAAFEPWEQIFQSSMKTTFSLDDKYFNENLTERVGRDVFNGIGCVRLCESYLFADYVDVQNEVRDECVQQSRYANDIRHSVGIGARRHVVQQFSVP